MQPKPPGLGPRWGAQFGDEGVAAAYVHRPPYPPAVFEHLTERLPDLDRRAVLDLGCGTGDVARPLARFAARVDAVDPSRAMLARGRALPGGDAPNLRWIEGPAEDAPLDAPYGLAVAGESLHWMDWARVFPRLAAALDTGGWLVLIEREEVAQPWAQALRTLIPQYSTNDAYVPYDLVAELTARELLDIADVHVTPEARFEIGVDDHVEAMHSRNGFSRDRMDPQRAAAFDRAYRALLAPHALAGRLAFGVRARLVWGHPVSRRAP